MPIPSLQAGDLRRLEQLLGARKMRSNENRAYKAVIIIQLGLTTKGKNKINMQGASGQKLWVLKYLFFPLSVWVGL